MEVNTETSTDIKVATLLSRAARAASQKEEEQAGELYREVLKLQPANERALVWLAWHTTDVYEARDLFEKIVELYPEDASVQQLYTQAKQRCQELDQLVNSSSYLNRWNEIEQAMQDRLRRSRDTRANPIPYVGEMLVRAGYITKDQLENTINLQQMFKGLGQEKKLGQMLVEYGYVTRRQLRQTLQAQAFEYGNQFY